MQNCGQVAKSTLSGAPWPISGAQICGQHIPHPCRFLFLCLLPCFPLQSFGICRDNNQQRLCVVSKLGRSFCSCSLSPQPWVRVVSLRQSSHKYEHWHWQRRCSLLPSYCCPAASALILLLPCSNSSCCSATAAPPAASSAATAVQRNKLGNKKLTFLRGGSRSKRKEDEQERRIVAVVEENK